MLGMLNELMGQEATNAMLRDNTRKTGQALNFAGVSILTSKVSSVLQTVSATSYTPLTEYQFGFTSNGGLVIALGSIYVGVGNNTITIQGNLDGEQKILHVVGSPSTVNSHIPFVWSMQLPSGSHTFKFNAKVDGGAVEVGKSTSISTFYILECRNANQGVQ